jgi:hypothetical protein
MRKSLLVGVNEKDMAAYIAKLTIPDMVYPNLFPLKFTPTLNWKTLKSETGIPVAADVVSYDASAPTKTRDVVGRASGDIPKIEIKRVMGESKLNEYKQLTHYAGNDAAQMELIRFVYDDVDFVFKGVNARLEWLALQALSTGLVSLTKNNNEGLVTETSVNFNIPSANKLGYNTFAAKVAWTVANAATSKPISNIKEVVKAAKAKGRRVNYILMDNDTFDALAVSAETISYAASWVVKATNLALTPNIESVNAALRSNGLPEIKIVDSLVTLEKADGTRTTVSPWASGKITFISEMVVGNTWHGPIAAEDVATEAVKTKRQHILIQKWGQVEPTAEFTKGTANAFPVLNDPDGIWMLDTLNTTFTV